MTRQFFIMMNKQKNTAELPVVTATDVLHVNIPPVSHDLIETEHTEPGTTSPRTYLPNGSPQCLDPLLQLPVDLEHGYNMYQKDTLKSLPEKMETPQEVTHQNLLYWKAYLMS